MILSSNIRRFRHRNVLLLPPTGKLTQMQLGICSTKFE